jgi:hypothetical protein
MDASLSHPRAKQLSVAGLLAVLGLGTAVVYTLRSTPYTMVLFMGGGQLLLLAALVVFLWVVAADIRARLQSVVEKHFKKGEIVFRQGDPSDRLYAIGRGEAEVVRENPAEGDTILARLGPGEFFGEMGILGNAPRMATVRATTDLEVLSIHRVYFGQLYAYLPTLREGIMAEYRRRAAQPGRSGKGGSDGGSA